MIILDTETTGNLKPDIADLAAQPHIIEIALIALDSKWKEGGRYSQLINPQVPLDEELHERITGLKEMDLANKPTFLEVVDELADFFLGQQTLVAHNCEFDRGVLACELRRIGREYMFPWPPVQICTVERTKHLKGQRLKLTELYKLKMGRELKQTHRAMADCAALADIVREMKIK